MCSDELHEGWVLIQFIKNIYVSKYITHIYLYNLYNIWDITCIIWHILLKLHGKNPVYLKLDWMEYVGLWSISWGLLKLVQSAMAQLCEPEKCLHLFWITV